MTPRRVGQRALAPGLLVWVYMRNLGLALLFFAMVAAPHAVHAKKHPAHKKQARSAKHAKPVRARETHQTMPIERDDLSAAVASNRASPKPTPTAAAAPPQEAAPSNAPMTMTNQDLDGEVPGSRKRK